jgi:uncharacterized repeat protein (TIGR03803 family)
VYTGAITVSSSEIIEAIATASGYSQSAVATADYIINSTQVAATPTFTPSGGTFSTAQTVTISDATLGATIYYTTNGSSPTSSSTVYRGPITVSSSQTIEAIATASGYSTSLVGSSAYTILTQAPAEWTWMDRSSSVNQPGVYGTLAIPAAANNPGGRQIASSWTDSSGDVWLFGGWGYDANGTLGQLNDVWRFNPSANRWTWMGGSKTVGANGGQPGVYGTLGTPAPANIPGGRAAASTWSEGSGNFWLFGGSGYDANGNLSTLNDLWEFSPSTNEWTWITGSSSAGQSGVYGILGTPAAGNIPGSRKFTTNWTDGGGNFWLFGGFGDDANGAEGWLNDLWEFSPSTNQWTWMSGSSSVGSNGGQPGAYGNLGTPASTNIPGGRQFAASWTDTSGNLWLFGGEGLDGGGNYGQLNDLWEFNPATNKWAWIGGSSTVGSNGGQTGVYGTVGTPASSNIPGGRGYAASWVDSGGNFWLFAGNGFGASGNQGDLNDLWVYQPSEATASQVSTPTFSPSAGAYSTAQSVTISDTTQGATIYYTTDGTTPSTNSTMYTGPIPVAASETIEAIATASGYTQSTVGIATYVISNTPVTPTPTFSPQGGVYSSAQTVTLSDTSAGAKIYYTTNNTTPTTSSTLYSGPITVSTSETIQAIAIASGSSMSPVVIAEFVISSGDQGQFTTLASFIGSNGAQPSRGALIQGLDGNFYGATSLGGATNHGTVFRVTPAGALSTMYSFCSQNGCTDGSMPDNTLVLAANQVMYGVTWGGGTNQCTYGTQTTGCGTIFQIGPGGEFSTLHNFAGSDGAFPAGPLVAGADGNLYGTTSAGGANNTGTVFRLTPGGNLTTLYSFCSGNSCGAGPNPVIQGADGNFYGTAAYTIFKVTPQGAATTLATMGGSLGYGLSASLVQAANGNFYGVAAYGGNSGNAPSCHDAAGGGFGTVFSVTPGGQETTLYSFQNALDGATPEAALIQATDGNFYGTTPCGGTGEGTIFSISPAGVLTPLHSFGSPNAYGAGVQGGLVQGTDGSFYGATPYTGTNNQGTVFNISLGLSPFVKTIPSSGSVGSVIQILGNNLTGSTAVSFNGTAANFIVVSGSNIQATVPAGATTGTVTVTTASGTLSSNLPFQVTAQAATPAFLPASGNYSSPQTVTISDATPGAVIYFTIDGAPPTTSSTHYTGPVTVSSSETIQAISTASGYATSAVGSAAYTFGVPIAATPTFSLAPGTYTSVQSLTISDATTGATIYYTIDGTTPTTNSTIYSGPITVSNSETIEAIATATGYAISAIASATYTTYIPGFGAPANSQPIVITVDPGATTGNTAQISVVGTNGFSGTVNLSCSISPSYTDPPTCTLSPGSVTLSGTTVKTFTLTVSTTAPTSADSRPVWRQAGGVAFALILLLAVPRRRRSWLAMLVLLAIMASGGVLGCGGIGAGHRSRFSGTSGGTYTITLTGTSGTTSDTITTVTLIVQ